MKQIASTILVLFFFSTSAAQEANINFETGTFSQALEKAKMEGKYLFIDCYTSWCVPCKKLAKEVFTDKRVADYFNEKFINMKLDVEKGEGVELRKRFGVQPVPTLLFINADGEVEHKFIGAAQTEEFIKLASEVFTKENRYGVLQRKFKAGERDLDFMGAYIYELINQSEHKKAKELLLKVLDSTRAEQLCNQTFWTVLTDKFIAREPPIYKLLIANERLLRKNIGSNAYDQNLSQLFISKANTWVFRGAKEYNKKIFNDLRNDIKKLSLKNQQEVLFIIDIAEARVSNDFDAFLSLMEKSSKNMSNKNAYSILVNSSFMAREGSISQCQRFLNIMNKFISSSSDEDMIRRLGNYNKALIEKCKNK